MTGPEPVRFDRLQQWLKPRPWMPVAASMAVWLLAVMGIQGGGLAPMGWAMAIGAFAVAVLLGALAVANHVTGASSELERRRRARNIAIGLALFGLVVLFYVATVVRLGGNALNRPM